MKYIVDKTAWKEACDGIICCQCPMSDGTGACRMGEYIKKQPVYEERPHGECRDRLKEVFREQSSISGDMFHLSQIERIIDGEVWL